MEKSKTIDKKEFKIKRLCEFILNRPGEMISPTNLAHQINIHKDTLTDIADMKDSLQEAGFQTLRDKNGRLLKIFSSDEALDTKKEMRALRKEVMDSLDELKSIIKRK